ncbi:MAG TPA: site-specific integrase [Sphingobium sp.]|uniref:tyrosine-type recombinase/integrase n=1 Tax=Sphingobium sp. TaxID=1912891 RepID=UPI002ED548AA
MASVKKRKWMYNGVEKEAWTVRYKDAQGNARQRTFDKKKDADRYRLKVLNELDSGVHVPKAEHCTFDFVYAAFQEEMRELVAIGKIKNTTMRGRLYALNLYAVPEFTGRMIQTLTPEDVIAWHRKLLLGGMHPGTAANRVQMLGQVLEYARAKPRRWIMTNVVQDEELQKVIRVRRQRIRTFEPDQVRNLLALVQDRPGKQRVRGHAISICFVNLAAFCGMRFGEIAGLKRDLVDWETGRIQIRYSLDTLKQLGPPKTEEGNRDIYAPAHVLAMLKEFVERFPSSDPEGLIFTTATKAADGTGIWPRPSTLAAKLEIRRNNIDHATRVDNSQFQQHYWKPLLLRAGLHPTERVLPDGTTRKTWHHFHGLRHFAASFMLENKWSIPEVQHQLGHSDPAITLRVYSHLIKNTDETARATQELAHRLLPTAHETGRNAQEVCKAAVYH